MRKIKRERMIGLTEAIDAALGMVEDFSGLKPSQYCRFAIQERLIKDGLMEHPAAVRFKNINPQNMPAE